MICISLYNTTKIYTISYYLISIAVLSDSDKSLKIRELNDIRL